MLRPQMAFAQVNHEAWEVLSDTPRYKALKAMKENCDIVRDGQQCEYNLNLASRVMMPRRFPTTNVHVWLPLGQVCV